MAKACERAKRSLSGNSNVTGMQSSVVTQVHRRRGGDMRDAQKIKGVGVVLLTCSFKAFSYGNHQSKCLDSLKDIWITPVCEFTDSKEHCSLFA